jgi:hypothetical protein
MQTPDNCTYFTPCNKVLRYLSYPYDTIHAHNIMHNVVGAIRECIIGVKVHTMMSVLTGQAID